MNTQQVKYNGYDLDLIDYFTITGVTSYAPPNRNVNPNKLAEADKSVITSDYYSHKIIEVKGYIHAPSKASLELVMDTLNGKLDYREQDLVIPQSGTFREYTATMQNIAVSEQGGGFAEVLIVFMCSDPFGYETTYTTALTVSNQTTNNTSKVVTIDGNTDQLPIITITFDSLTGGSGADFSIENGTRGETITFTRDWVALDVLTINCETGVASVGGSVVDFVGRLPILSKGSNTLIFDDTLTARQIDISITYRKRYI